MKPSARASAATGNQATIGRMSSAMGTRRAVGTPASTAMGIRMLTNPEHRACCGRK